jgi:hypothetical protein
MTKLAELIRPIAGPARLRVTADEVLRANQISPAAAKLPFMHEMMRDTSQALALCGINQAEFERRALAYLQECAADMKPPVKVEPHIRQATGVTVAGYVRKPAVPVDHAKLAQQRTAALKTAQRVATVIMNIDGVDIRDFTIGQCRSAAKHKSHEAYVLRVLGNQYGHLDHTKRIGDLVSDSDLKSIVAQGYEHAFKG